MEDRRIQGACETQRTTLFTCLSDDLRVQCYREATTVKLTLIPCSAYTNCQNTASPSCSELTELRDLTTLIVVDPNQYSTPIGAMRVVVASIARNWITRARHSSQSDGCFFVKSNGAFRCQSIWKPNSEERWK